MPTVNIPPKVRFALYLAGVLGAVFVQYAMDRSWFGDAEMRLWTGLSAVLFMLAAAKVNTKTEGDFSADIAALRQDQAKSIGKAVGDAINSAARDGATGRGRRG